MRSATPGTADGVLKRGHAGGGARRLIVGEQFNALLRLILDFYNIDDLGNLLQIYFDPNTFPGADAEIVSDENQQPAGVRFSRQGMTQGFERLIHTVAHEMEHVRLNRQGETDLPTHEFLGESVEILSVGMREEELPRLRR